MYVLEWILRFFSAKFVRVYHTKNIDLRYFLDVFRVAQSWQGNETYKEKYYNKLRRNRICILEFVAFTYKYFVLINQNFWIMQWLKRVNHPFYKPIATPTLKWYQEANNPNSLSLDKIYSLYMKVFHLFFLFLNLPFPLSSFYVVINGK